MDITNRNRRLREFLTWFEYKFGFASQNIKVVGVQRVIEQTLAIQKALETNKPVCYWCRQTVIPASIDVDVDDVTLHHVDEDRKHNTVDNLEMCHKTCHQKMHKLSQKNCMPTVMLWTLAYGRYESTGHNVVDAISGLGRG